MIIKTPMTGEEWEKCYDLRWRILRAPWNQPRGSETDEHEKSAITVMAIDDENNIVGTGRAHFNNKDEAQIRFMAVENNYRGKGVGAAILFELEKKVIELGAKTIVLNSRDTAVEFYKHHGYQLINNSHTLFDAIPHFFMEKKI
ncbi:MAG TPA: GNAT family N-acetyltransferase [Ignavibacteriaceae bacterium]|nr:GNAT family N-acetyltransferase [Ignavibacteriaceae bacterium]